ncbi:MAG: alpha/beta fold hydrolase, partial [Stackebrandtia sp.]
MNPVFTDTTVYRDTMPLAVRDYGGQGIPLLLLHGLGGTLDVWNHFAPLLTDHHRVVAMELRGHGRSGGAEWDWQQACDDIDAVTIATTLDRPFVVGQSLGGMLAAMWAGQGDRARGIVSLDGHRSAHTDSRHYLGMDADTLAVDRAALAELFDAQSQAMARPLPPEHLAALPSRAITEIDGHQYIRPSRKMAEQIRRSPRFIDSIPEFAAVTCPTLILAASLNSAGMPSRFDALMTAYRAGLRRDLD